MFTFLIKNIEKYPTIGCEIISNVTYFLIVLFCTEKKLKSDITNEMPIKKHWIATAISFRPNIFLCFGMKVQCA